jgi:hypothetical protein
VQSRAARFVVAAFALAAPIRAQSIVGSFWGSSAGLEAGAEIAAIGDINADGYHDFAVGAPGYDAPPVVGDGEGAIYFVSGKYLATGTGFSTLGALFGAPGDWLGNNLLNVGDMDGDGLADVLCEGFATGSLKVVSSGTKSVIGSYPVPNFWFYGRSMCLTEDVDGDGHPEVLLTQLYSGGYPNAVARVSPYKMVHGGTVVMGQIGNLGDIAWLRVASADLNGDGRNEVLATTSYPEVHVYDGQTLAYVGALSPGTTHNTYELDASRDVTGDGVRDVLVGSAADDQAVLFSGALAYASPSTAKLATFSGIAGSQFGASVRMTPDMNGDFYSDFVVGAPDFDAGGVFGTQNGQVRYYSGRTLELMGQTWGISGEQMGSELSTAWDLTSDIRFEIAVGSGHDDSHGTDSGMMRILSLFPNVPATYCAAKTNSQGCLPYVWYSGSPSASASSGFAVNATQVLNKKNGLLFYGYDAVSQAFQGGTLCVKAPVKRTAVQNSGGSSSGADCTGNFSFDLNAYIHSGKDPVLALQGAEVFCQYWYRDPASPSGTGLTNALRFVVNP